MGYGISMYSRKDSVSRRRSDAIRKRAMITDRKALIRAIRICDFDIKAKLKEGVSAVAGGLDWVSSKMKEKIDPAKFKSEQEAKIAEKQKLKELSTIKGLLKECGKLIKNKVVGFGGKIKEGAVSALQGVSSKLLGFIKGSSIWKLLGSGAALIGFVKIIIMIGKALLSMRKQQEAFQNKGVDPADYDT